MARHAYRDARGRFRSATPAERQQARRARQERPQGRARSQAPRERPDAVDALLGRLGSLPGMSPRTIRFQLGRMSPALRRRALAMTAGDWQNAASSGGPGNPFHYHPMSDKAMEELAQTEWDADNLSTEELETDFGE